ncbi:MAG: hypothetical protein ACLVKO_01505 [Dysgonomonas sp.]
MSKKYDNDYIERYLLGELSEKESSELEQEMSGNETLKQEVKIMSNILLAIDRRYEAPALAEMASVKSKDEMRSILVQAESKYKTQKKRKKKLLPIILAVAGVILVLVYIGLQPEYSSPLLFKEYYEPLPYEEIYTRGSNSYSEEQQQLIEKANIYYSENNFAEALKIYNGVTSEMKKEDIPSEVIMYQSICMLETGNTQESIDRLRLLSVSESVFRQDAEWYLSLAYLVNKQRNDAEKLLTKICSDKNHRFSGKAHELLKQLNERKWF